MAISIFLLDSMPIGLWKIMVARGVIFNIFFAQDLDFALDQVKLFILFLNPLLVVLLITEYAIQKNVMIYSNKHKNKVLTD